MARCPRLASGHKKTSKLAPETDLKIWRRMSHCSVGRSATELRLVRQPEHEPNIVIDRNATAFEQRWSIAPLANGGYGRRDQ